MISAFILAKAIEIIKLFRGVSCAKQTRATILYDIPVAAVEAAAFIPHKKRPITGIHGDKFTV